MATLEQAGTQKALLPMGWGRFGKAIDHLVEVTAADEPLLAACVTLNPTFVHRSISLVGGLYEMTKATNVVLGATDRRLVIVATGIGGGPVSHEEISYSGLAVAGSDKKTLTLRWPDGEATFKGAAKPMLGPLMTVLTERIGAAGGGSAS